jgi:hypothetical protein
MRHAYKIVVGKSERKSPPGRPSHRREDNVRMVIKAIVWEGVDWMHVAQDRDQ